MARLIVEDLSMEQATVLSEWLVNHGLVADTLTLNVDRRQVKLPRVKDVKISANGNEVTVRCELN